MKLQNITLLLSFLLVFGVGEFYAQPRYAKMTDTVFHVGHLIQHEFEQRFSLGPPRHSEAQKAGIDDYDSLRLQHFPIVLTNEYIQQLCVIYLI